MVRNTAATLLSLVAAVSAQQVGTNTKETHPGLTSQTCTSSGCTTQNTKIVLDANWRWTHTTTGYTNCYTGNKWDATLCPDPTTCATNCAVDGADYTGTYGITASGSSLNLKFVTQGSSGANVGSRVYLMDTDSSYKIFKLINREFTFDVDTSKLGCGLNGALYFSQMDADGGLAKYTTNKAGAAYGTGYCDAQCPRDLKFINGLGNTVWTPDASNPNVGAGSTGSCCTEMDIWEANSFGTAYTPHPCAVEAQTACTGKDCGIGDRYASLCDADGCDFNSYRLGNQSFYGPGLTVDSTKPITVVTQFITNDGTDTGTLSAIRRFYVQNGVTIPNSMTEISGITPTNEIDDKFCTEQKSVFVNTDGFHNQGGFTRLQKAFSTGMVLVMSLWDDSAANCLWLDATYPVGGTNPGDARGPCGPNSGDPKTLESTVPNSAVTFSNIKFGTIGSTFKAPAGGSNPPPPPPPSSSTTTTKAVTTSAAAPTTKPVTTTTTSVKPVTTASVKTTTTSAKPATTTAASGGSLGKYAQCGGTGWTGTGTCVSGTTCKYSNAYYSQCL